MSCVTPRGPKLVGSSQWSLSIHRKRRRSQRPILRPGPHQYHVVQQFKLRDYFTPGQFDRAYSRRSINDRTCRVMKSGARNKGPAITRKTTRLTTVRAISLPVWVALIQRPAITTTSPPRTTVHANTNRVVDAPWRDTATSIQKRLTTTGVAPTIVVLQGGNTLGQRDSVMCGVCAVRRELGWLRAIERLVGVFDAYGACPSTEANACVGATTPAKLVARAPRGATKPMDAWWLWRLTRTGMDACSWRTCCRF